MYLNAIHFSKKIEREDTSMKVPCLTSCSCTPEWILNGCGWIQTSKEWILYQLVQARTAAAVCVLNNSGVNVAKSGISRFSGEDTRPVAYHGFISRQAIRLCIF